MLLCSLANGTAYLRNHFDELEEDRKTHRKELTALKAKMKKCTLCALTVERWVLLDALLALLGCL